MTNNRVRRFHSLLCGSIVAVVWIWAVTAPAQAAKAAPAESATTVQRGISLAEKGHCQEALPILKRSLPRTLDKELRYKGAILHAQCAMSLNQTDAALEALAFLNREFPGDPQALYTTAHFCSQLAEGAAQRLARDAPTSYQAQELDAESFEAHGNWDKAAATYRKILEQYPNLRGIHYRLGRIVLSQPATTTSNDDARREFEAELKIDPSSAPAEFMLGDLARQEQQWDQAMKHFRRAAELDADFSEAYLGLGVSLNAAGRFQEAVIPLETYTKAQPEDPAGHYHLAFAYSRTGRNQDAARELAIQRQLDQKKNKDIR